MSDRISTKDIVRMCMAASAVVVLEEEDDAKGLVRRGGSKPGPTYRQRAQGHQRIMQEYFVIIRRPVYPEHLFRRR